MKCTPFAGGVICGPDVCGVTLKTKGKTYHFDFDRHFGPLLTSKDGIALKRQPGEKHPFWPAFNRWLKRQK